MLPPLHYCVEIFHLAKDFDTMRDDLMKKVREDFMKELRDLAAFTEV